MTETRFIYPIANYSVIFLQESEQSPNFVCAVLLILLVLTLVLNSFVLLSILGCPFRSSPWTASVASAAFVSLLDGLFSVTSSVVFHASWAELPALYGENVAEEWCRANATVLQVTGMTQTFAFGILSYDRLYLLKDRRSEDIEGVMQKKEKTQVVLRWLLFLSVFASVVMALPVGFGVLAVSFFEHRMSCSPIYVTKKPESVILAVGTFSAYLSSWFFTLYCGFVTVRMVLNERRRLADLELVARRRAAERGSPVRGVTNSNPGHRNGFILTGLLVTSFMIAVVPNIITVQISQFYNDYDMQDILLPNGTNPRLKQIQTDVFDSIFAWTRHGYNAFSPGLILFFHEEIRNHCKATFCCCCSLGNNDFLPNQMRFMSAFVKNSTRKKRKKTIADYRTPVLFATSQGLHLRTVLRERLEHGEPEFLVKFCDLVMGETSTVQKKRELVELSPRSKSNETFVVREGNQSRKFGETFVKSPNESDESKISRYRNNTIELDVVSEKMNSTFSLSHKMQMRDS